MLINGLGIGVPYGTSGGGSGGSGSILATSSLYLPLKTTIVPTRGASTPTFTRATAAWSFDNEGKLNQNIPSGCVRFKGGRLVRNLVTGNSENFTNASWVKSNVTAPSASLLLSNNTTATQYVYQTGTFVVNNRYLQVFRLQYTNHRYVQLGFGASFPFANDYVNIDLLDGTLSISGACVATITPVSSGIWDVTASSVCNSASGGAGPLLAFINTMADTRLPSFVGNGVLSVGVIRAGFYNVSGQADQTPSEYVSVGVLSSPYHGAGVDGCKWFPTNKDGSAIPSSTLEGYFAEPGRTNNCLWNRDLTNVAWTKTNITAAKTTTGLDNVPNSATRLTAAATDATITQLLTAATGTRTLSAYIKRISGTGTISLTRNGGTNWTDITSSLVTGSWVLVQMTSDVGANPTVGIKMGTSGDVIDVDCVQDENSAWATSPILTTTAAVTRNADVLSYASAFDVTQGTSLCSIKSDVPHNTSDIYFLNGDSADARIGYLLSAVAKTTSYVYDGTSNTTAAGLSVTTNISKRASRWGPNLRVCADGTLGAQVAFDGSMGATATLYVGCSQASINHLSGNIGEVHVWNAPLTDAQMQQVTT